MGTRLLVCAARPQPADVLFTVAQEPRVFYLELFKGVHPHTFVLIHWDNFTRSLNKPLRKFTRPGRMQIWQITRLARQTLSRVKVIIPEIFRKYAI
jgi:hypothetical protein